MTTLIDGIFFGTNKIINILVDKYKNIEALTNVCFVMFLKFNRAVNTRGRTH